MKSSPLSKRKPSTKSPPPAHEIWKADFTKFQNQDYFTNDDAIYRFCEAHDFKKDVVLENWKELGGLGTMTTDQTRSAKMRKPSRSRPRLARCSGIKPIRKEDLFCTTECDIHQKNLGETDELLRFFIYSIEKGCQEADQNGSRRIVVIYDRNGFNKKNYDENSMNLHEEGRSYFSKTITLKDSKHSICPWSPTGSTE